MLCLHGAAQRRRRPHQPERPDRLGSAIEARVVGPAEGRHERGLGDPRADRLETLDRGQPGVGIGMVDRHLDDERDSVGRPDPRQGLEEEGPHLRHRLPRDRVPQARHRRRIDDLAELFGGRCRGGRIVEPTAQLLQPRAPLLLGHRLPLRSFDQLDLLAGPPSPPIPDEPPRRHERLLGRGSGPRGPFRTSVIRSALPLPFRGAIVVTAGRQRGGDQEGRRKERGKDR